MSAKPARKINPALLAPVPQFTDPLRREKLASAFPRVRELVREFASAQNVPGLAFGIVIDDALVFCEALGVRQVESGAPVTRDTVFRIASMSKSFIAMSI